MSDKDKVLQICTRIDRALQRDWGSTGKSLAEKVKTSKYAIPGHLAKRISYLSDLERKATKRSDFRLKSADDFVRKGEQVLDELQAARVSARRKIGPLILDLARRHRVVTGLLGLVLVAGPVVGYVLLQPAPEPVFPPIPQKKRVVPNIPAATASAPQSAASQATAPEPVTSAPVAAAENTGPAPVAQDVDALPPDLAAGTRFLIDAPQGVGITVKRAEITRTGSDRQEISVILEIQNLGYESLKRITFDAWLYDMSGKKPVALISPARMGTNAPPLYAFLRQSLKRGLTSEIRLSYPADSIWMSDKAIELVKSGRYLIRLNAVTLADGQDKTIRQ